MHNEPKQRLLRLSSTTAVYLLMFWLFWEWFKPLFELSSLTDMHMTRPFWFAIAGFFVLHYARLPSFFVCAGSLLICFSIIGHYFYQSSLVSPHLWGSYATEFVGDMDRIMAGQWMYVSGETRTLAFLGGWAFAIHGVLTIVVQRLQCGWFLGVTAGYLAFMNAWSGVDVYSSLLRVACAGLALMSLLQFMRMQSWSVSGAAGTRMAAIWIGASSAIIALAVFAGLQWASDAHSAEAAADPKEGPLQAWFKDSWKEAWARTEDEGISGFGLTDDRLGLSIEPDESVAFTARTPRLTYWRAETKQTYTGQGWQRPVEEAIPWSERGMEAESGTGILQEITVKDRRLGRFILAGGALSKIEAAYDWNNRPLPEPLPLEIFPTTGLIGVASEEPLSYYQVVVHAGPEGAGEDAEALGDYLRLPDALPSRVKDLALELTEGAVDAEDKIERIRKYLASFEYRLEELEMPAQGRDFVDFFLFEQQAGYCDHFSTSMAVMLRAAGIPSRWVKGFAPGEITETDEIGVKTVVVRNSNAHSWVEAYVDGKGWTTVEATPGYAEAIDAGAEAGSDGGAEAPLRDADANVLIDRAKSGVDRIGAMPWTLIFAGISLIGATLFLGGRATLRLRRFARDSLLRMRGGEAFATYRAERLWLRLYDRYGGKPKDATLREYVIGLARTNKLDEEALLRFVQLYEGLRYSPRRPWVTKRQLEELERRLLG